MPNQTRSTSAETLRELRNTAQLSEFFAPQTLQTRRTSDKRRLILWKSKSMVAKLKIRLSGPSTTSRRTSRLVMSSTRTRWLIPLPLQEVKEPKVLSRDSDLPDFQERHIEVS